MHPPVTVPEGAPLPDPTLSDPTLPDPSGAPAPSDFGALGLSQPILRELRRLGIETPFPIQSAVVPDVLAGRDVAGRAPTGSGKTLAFGLPLVNRLTDAAPTRPTALVLAPTRELAEQISRELMPFAKAVGHWTLAVYGGVGYRTQVGALERGTELVVACPGRLEDLLSMGAIDLSDVQTVVVDEADQMSDMGFLPAVRRILDRTSADRQVLLFSATLDGPVAALVDDYQRDAVRHEVGPQGPDMAAARHLFWRLERTERVATTAQIVERLGSTIVFTRTRHGADRLARQLGKQGVRAEAIHGGRSQPQRNKVLHAFTQGKCSALIATDVAARGIHVEGVAAVVHFDLPADGAAYVHRSGRTARAGATGTVVTFVEPSQRAAARAVARAVGVEYEPTAPDADALSVATPSMASDHGRHAGEQAAARADATHETPHDGTERGVVKFFHTSRGYGFIRRALGGDDLFVHYTNIETDGFRTLDRDTDVTFTVAPGRRGPEAFRVRVAG